MLAKARLSARSAARFRSTTDLWIDHAEIVADDLDWLRPIEKLTLWNVIVPQDVLRQMPALWSLDWRGGTKESVDEIRECRNLRYLSLNQINNLHDIGAVVGLEALEYLSLYGLRNILALPSFAGLKALVRLELGQLKGIQTIAPALDALRIEELLLSKMVTVTPDDVASINRHPHLKTFSWFLEDVPVRVFEPVLSQISLPAARTMHAHEWFAEREAGRR
ncbi:leucine-rich repeat domain-containing protein [Mesorhizobium sp. LHD-90]|uniref:leucine-rich repeat domain-containing protein n=1 Tax=Mesorhizobium sp. LHD-90 TaxID=3071414 RepID=UPI0027DEE88A|nr:leucine-rich repeat domain-containing protein [Mesorhizobium sp. LHD-90]MDQ6437273.1 leucine-rich repeat domain-containing protein [Mesorhizobium sp. LHD-90]